MAEENSSVDVAVLSEVVNALNKLDQEGRVRMLQSLATLFGISTAIFAGGSAKVTVNTSLHEPRTSFSEDRSMSPKDFVWQKQPKTAIERVACLAYYLTHYKGVQQFKTSDITDLNMEAAQIKFSNPAMMVAEAVRRGYLVSAGGQLKQLSAMGEQFARLLPDREAAEAAISGVRPRRYRRKLAADKGEQDSE